MISRAPRVLPAPSFGLKIRRRDNGTYSGFALWNYVGGFSYTRGGQKAAARRVNETTITYADLRALKLAWRHALLRMGIIRGKRVLP